MPWTTNYLTYGWAGSATSSSESADLRPGRPTIGRPLLGRPVIGRPEHDFCLKMQLTTDGMVKDMDVPGFSRSRISGTVPVSSSPIQYTRYDCWIPDIRPKTVWSRKIQKNLSLPVLEDDFMQLVIAAQETCIFIPTSFSRLSKFNWETVTNNQVGS